MNRPRNRQPRPPRNNANNPGRGPRARSPRTNANVPTTAQVVPGSSVSIVLKADQPTGREVQGVVQELLTRGNHPRGIKVRLQDGRVGRVQRMASAATTAVNSQIPQDSFHSTGRTERLRRDDAAEPSGEPPLRNLADFIPDLEEDTDESGRGPETEGVGFNSATVKCPICDAFEGDEAAVSHHVLQEHVT